MVWVCQKSLKIAKGKSEAVNHRTDIAMAYRKRAMIYKSLYKNLKNEHHEPRKDKQFLFYS
jgi:ABC-type phosphate transport system ATPase subunit